MITRLFTLLLLVVTVASGQTPAPPEVHVKLSYPQILSELTALYYSDAIGALLKKLMETDDAAMASHAAYLIGKYGSPSDEQLLEARLKRWQEQWRDRVAEADAQQQGQIERELIYALVNGKSWKLSTERVRELQTSCLTQMCKQNNVVPK